MKNPFDYQKKLQMFVTVSGIEIGGGNLAAIFYDALTAHHRITIDPWGDQKAEALRLGRQSREREVARRRGEATTRRYQESVKSVLTEIRSTATGRAVLSAIEQNAATAKIRISPHFGPVERQPNASASATPSFGERERRFGPKPAHVSFTPAHWRRNDDMAKFLAEDLGIAVNDDWGPGTTPDEVLLHELIHALFIVTGKPLKRRVPFQGRRYLTESRNPKHPEWRGPNEMDEFMAIMITNIHHSELKRDRVRHSHTDHVGHNLSAEDFLDIGMNRAHVRLLRRKQPRLFNALNDVEAAWNPLKDFRDAVRA